MDETIEAPTWDIDSLFEEISAEEANSAYDDGDIWSDSEWEDITGDDPDWYDDPGWAETDENGNWVDDRGTHGDDYDEMESNIDKVDTTTSIMDQRLNSLLASQPYKDYYRSEVEKNPALTDIIVANSFNPVTGKTANTLAANAIMGRDDNAAIQFMCIYGIDPTGVKTASEAGQIKLDYERAIAEGKSPRSAMNTIEKENSELYNFRNELLKQAGLATVNLFGGSVIGALGQAALSSAAYANGAYRMAKTVQNIKPLADALVAIGKMGNTGIQGKASATAMGRGLTVLLNSSDKIGAITNAVLSGAMDANEVIKTIMSGGTVPGSTEVLPGMMTDAQREQMLAELRAQQSTAKPASVPKDTITNSLEAQANAKPGDIVNGHVLTQGDITWAQNQINPPTGQGFDMSNGFQSNPNTFNITMDMPTGLGVPAPLGNKIDDFGDTVVVTNYNPTPYTPSSSNSNSDTINTTNSSNNKPTDTNPGTGTQTTKSVDDSSDDSSSDVDLGWNEETNKPNNPNNPGSDTTDGTNPNTPESDTIKDKNGETIDWDINKNRIGLSDDPNRANYDQADNSKWNRGMEFQSTNLVSDETVKSFISKTYKDDPIFKNAIRIIKEKKLWD